MQIHALKFLFFVLPTAMLSACASKVTDQQWAEFCHNTIWYEHGYDDGEHGRSLRMIDVYQQRCGDHLSAEERQKYQSGFIAGIQHFCTFDNGYQIGLNNDPHPGACPFELAEPFDAGFNSGKIKYQQSVSVLNGLRDFNADINLRAESEENHVRKTKDSATTQ